MTTFWRIQSANREVADLLHTEQTSHYWGRADLDQTGVSVCETRDDLARYLATAGQGIPIGAGDWVLVELTGDLLDTAIDADAGELLIQPTAIISVTPADDDFYELIGAYYEEALGL